MTGVGDGGKGRRVGQYVICGALSRGDASQVLLARDELEPPAYVAIKEMLPRSAENPDAVSIFLREIDVGARLVHPNIVRVLDYGCSDGRYFSVMEYVDGHSLLRIREAGGRVRFPTDVALGIVRELALGLEHAHRCGSSREPHRGVVHCNLEPANVMLRRDGGVKLLDFGSAVVQEDDPPGGSGAVRPSHPYTPPELWKEERIDGRADVFGLGILLYELVLGRRPFRSSPSAALVVPGGSSRGLPAGLVRLIQRCSCLNRADRPGSACELAQELLELGRRNDLDLGPEPRTSMMRRLFEGVSGLRSSVGQPPTTPRLAPCETTQPGDASGTLVRTQGEPPDGLPTSSSMRPFRRRLKVARAGIVAGVAFAGMLELRGAGSAPDLRRDEDTPLTLEVLPAPEPAQNMWSPLAALGAPALHAPEAQRSSTRSLDSGPGSETVGWRDPTAGTRHPASEPGDAAADAEPGLHSGPTLLLRPRASKGDVNALLPPSRRKASRGSPSGG